MNKKDLSALNSLTKGSTPTVSTPPPPLAPTTPKKKQPITIIKKEKEVPPLIPPTIPVTFMNSNELKIIQMTGDASFKICKELLQKHVVERNEFQMFLQFLKRKILELEIKKQ